MRGCLMGLLLLPLLTFSQELTYSKVETYSLGYYNGSHKKELINLGKRAFRENIDYYELRVRLGLIYYYSKNYVMAWEHLSRAIEMNPSDPFILTCAYYSLLGSGQYARANEFIVSHKEVESVLKPKESGITSFELEPGYITTGYPDQFKGKALRQNGGLSGSGNFFSSMGYVRLYAEGLFTPRVRWHAGINAFQNTELSKFELYPFTPVGPVYNSETTKTDMNYQYNFGLSTLAGKHTTLAAGVGIYRENASYTYNSTAYVTPPPPPPPPVIRDTTASSTYVSVSGMISHRLKYIEPMLMMNYSNFNKDNHYQVELGVTAYPLGRDQLYSVTSVSLLNDSSGNNFAWQQKLGYAFTPAWSAEVNYLGGSLHHYTTNIGFMMLNTYDPMNWSAGADITYRKGRFAFTPGFRLQQREGTYEYEQGAGNFVSKTNTYTNQLLFITIKCQL